MSEVLESLKSEHDAFRRHLDLLEAEIAKYDAGGSPDYDLVDLLMDYFTSFPDEWHHKKEDAVYDVLIARSWGDADAFYDLRDEHERLTDGVRRLAERIEQMRLGGDLAAASLLDAGRQYAAHLREHMAREDADFIPTAELRLDENDWNEISSALAAELEASGRAAALARVADLERRIAAAVASGNDAPSQSELAPAPR